MEAQLDRMPLRQELAKHFSLAELKLLCHDSGVDHETVPYSERGTEVYAYCIVEAFRRKNQLPSLLRECAKARPGIDWFEFSVETAVPAEWAALFTPQNLINTQGGAVFLGTFNVRGDLVGRDKITITEEAAYTVSGLGNPYLGLRPFTYADRDAYAGRVRLIDDAVTLLTTPGQERTTLFVTGASGSGKSSFAQAGLLPALEAHYAIRGQRVRKAVFRPGARPAASLEDARRQLSAQHGDATPVDVIVIDQFEELFTQSQAEQRGALFAWLTGLPEFEQIKTHVIATLRSDYLKELFDTKPVWDIAKRSGIELRAMTADELKDAIQRPLQAKSSSDPFYQGKRFEPALVDRLANDAAKSPALLPLLQVTLEEIWKKGRLNLANFGSLTDAIQVRADTVFNYEDFDKAAPGVKRTQQAKQGIRTIFLQLVKVSDGDDADFYRDVRTSEQKDALTMRRADLGRLVDDLLRGRLLSTSDDGNTVSIIHESLITNWQTLWDAVGDKRDILQQRNRFQQWLEDWKRDRGNTDNLLTGSRLAQAQQLQGADIARALFDEAEAKAFLDASIAEQTRRDQKAKQQEQEKLLAAQALAETERKSSNRLRAFLVVVSIIAFVAAGLAGWAIWQTEQARIATANEQTAKGEALAAKATADSTYIAGRSREIAALVISHIATGQDPERTLLLAMEAVTVTRSSSMPITFEAEDALRKALFLARVWGHFVGHEDVVNSAQFSPDGKSIVTASDDKTARVWVAASGKQTVLLSGHEGFVTSAQFSPDGKFIVTASKDKTARVWDAASGKEIVLLSGHESAVASAQFSPDGRFVVTTGSGDKDKTVRVWDVASGRQTTLLSEHKAAVGSAQFSPDGKSILTTSLFGMVWDVASGEQTALLAGHEGPVMSARFSPDGKSIVTASDDKTARVWDAASGKQTALLAGHEGPVMSAQFSPDGRSIVTASDDKTARVWDAASGKQTALLSGHEGWVLSAQFSPDGKSIVTVGIDDKTARVWDAISGKQTALLSGQESGVTSAQFSPDGKSIVTSSYDRTARVWDVVSGKQNTLFSRHDDRVDSAQFSPDGKFLVTASWDNMARVWDAASGKQTALLSGHEGWVLSAQFSPDGKSIVTASADKTARVWNAASGKQIALLFGHEDRVTSAQFSPDGKSIVTASYDKSARVWDAASGKQTALLSGHESRVTSAQFSPDGKSIVTASAGTVRMWDAASGKQTTLLAGHEDRVTSAQFSPDGKFIVTASADKTARIWDAASGKQTTLLAGHEDRVTSAQFSPDGKSIVTASYDKSARVWDAASGRQTALLSGHEAEVTSAQFSPDGKFIVTASWDTTVRIYLVRIKDLMAVAQSRVTRQLSCQERVRHLNESLTCDTPSP